LGILDINPPELEIKACQAHKAGSSHHDFSAICISLVLGHTKNSSVFFPMYCSHTNEIKHSYTFLS